MAPPPTRTVADAFFDVLRHHGVTTLFGNPGSNELPMLKHLPDDFRYIVALHEGAAVAMAEGYARATGTVGVASLHSSSGTGNAMGMLTNAAAGHAPVVVIAGQQSRRHVPLNAMLANVDATRLCDPLVKWSGEPLRAEDTPLLASKALTLASTAPSGPVYLSVPMDDWDRPAEAAALAHLRERQVYGSPAISDHALEHIASALAEAASPAIVLGPGMDTDRGWASAVRLAAARRIPVWVAPSPSRAPFPSRHAMFQGVLPTGIGAVSDVLAGSDLILTFGAAVFRYHQSVEGELLPPGASLMGVTDDPDEATRAAVGVLAIGDPTDAMERLCERLDAPSTTPSPRSVDRKLDEPPPFPAESILDAVDRGKTSDTVVVLEWTSADALWPRLSLDRSGSYYFPASGGLGWGLPAAIGLALGDPGRPVVGLVGDGAMQYTPSALWSAARYSIPVTFVICQNREYGALQRFAQVMSVDDAPYLDLPHLDPVLIAHGYGIEAREISDLSDLSDFIAAGRTSTAPRLAVVRQRGSH